MTEVTARQICQTFANKHKIVFQDHGECGFGRPCVGFLHGNNYIDYNPSRYDPPDYDTVELIPHDARLRAPAGVEAYHKHECFAVLHQGDGEDASYSDAIIQLALWVQHLESFGEVELVEFATGASGLQAIVSGVFGHALRIK